MNSENDLKKGKGRLVFFVATARGAIPLEGAQVNLYNYIASNKPERGDLIFSSLTGADGKTQEMELETPLKSESLTPENLIPYAVYNAEVVLEGYYSQYYVALQVFDGITSVQSADMIPLPDNGRENSSSPDGTQQFETRPGRISGEEDE